MDPLSFSASLIAIITLANQIITRGRAWASAVREASNDLINILIEVGSVKSVLETLQLRLKLEPLSQKVESLQGPMEGCERVMRDLLMLLPVQTKLTGKKKRGEHTAAYAALTWPFKQGKARKLLEDLARFKDTIHLAVITDAR